MPDPVVSVVISCFNLGAYLDDAVGSVLAQTFQDFEIVIVDDGSTDPATVALLDTYQRPKTRIVRTPNRGLSAARNTGIRLTRGPFLCMLDADDCLEPAYMERSVRVLQDDPATGFVSHWLRTFGEESGEWTPRDCDLASLLTANPFNGAALFRREVWSAAGGFDEAMRDGLEDWDFWITAVEKGWRGRILPEFLFRYRRRADSMSRQMMNGAGFARLHRMLVDKHPDSYRQYLPTFLRESERESNALQAHIYELEAEHHAWLGPELLSLRDDVAVLTRKVERREEQRRIDAEHARLIAEAARLKAEAGDLTAEHARLSDEQTTLRNRLSSADAGARTLAAAVDHAQHEIRALHASKSWRLTRPLRLLYEWWLRLKRAVRTP
jgi:GT2 family glycosyltransferase